MIGSTVGNYRITARLGAGAMGEVYLAEDTRLQRQAAIKFLAAEMAADVDRRQRFLREARAASALNHPNVCIVYDVGETGGGQPFLAMEFVEGKSLEQLAAESQLPIARVVTVATQVADALEAAHSQRIVHRDIKPANINLNARGQVKVLDFGLAKRLSHLAAEGSDIAREMQETQAGTLLGTPAYMSPEQAGGEEVDHRSDLFSLGSVIYFLLTGRAPFGGNSLGELLNNVMHRQPEALARLNYDVPAELERIVLKLLAKDPERRYQSARDLLVDLKNLQRNLDDDGNFVQTAVVGPDDRHNTRLGSLAGVGGRHDETLLPDPQQIAESDVVITYANLDDQPVLAKHQGWISQLHQNLQIRVAQLSGKQVAVVKQPGTAISPDKEAEVLKHVPQAKTVVSVLSPPFVQSSGCRRIVETFWKNTRDSGRFQVNHRSRLLNVIKTPVEDDELPSEIRPLYTSLVPYEFFERDLETGRLREFDEAFGNTAVQRFHERVYDVAYDISQVLKYLGDAPAAEGRRTTNPKTIFLAATTSDLEPQRDQLRRELIELGHEVLPKQPLPLVANELVAAVESCLKQADMAIHFVGEHFGLVPEATALSVVALQNQVAARYCDGHPLQRLIWIPKDMQPRDERQESFLRELQTEPNSVTGAELIADTLENLKVLLRTRWDREQAAGEKQPRSSSAEGAPRVYLICDQRDEQAIEPLEDYFYEQGIEVSLPGFEASESEFQQIHIQNLSDCDAALIFYGVAGMHWVDFKIRDLQKAAGYRDSRPIPVSAVYLAPPFNRRKERFKSVSTEVFRQTGEAFEGALLEPFIESVRRAKEDVR